MKKLGVLLALLASTANAKDNWVYNSKTGNYFNLSSRLKDESMYSFRVSKMGKLEKPDVDFYKPRQRSSFKEPKPDSTQESNGIGVIRNDWTRNVDKWVNHYVNLLRKSEGKNQLPSNPIFEKAASYRSEHMVNSGFTHYPKDGQTFEKVLEKFGKSPYVSSGENIYQYWTCTSRSNSKKCDYAMSLDSLLSQSPKDVAKKIVKGYYTSKKGHKENMLDSENTSMGSGTIIFEQDSKLKLYNTNLFEK